MKTVEKPEVVDIFERKKETNLWLKVYNGWKKTKQTKKLVKLVLLDIYE
jgi:hypothetical protein